MANFVNLLTAKQVQSTYGWTDAQPIPIPGKHERVEFPLLDGVTAVLTKTAHKATYGGPLYRVEHVRP
jgi:hypothetical protein